MNSIKTTLLVVAMLSATPVLMAEEPVTPPPPTGVLTNAPVLPEDLAEQAALVQQIGEEAARGFDPEAHARELRRQIESLASMPANGKAPAATQTPALAETPVATVPVRGPERKPAPITSTRQAVTPVSPARETTVKEAVQRVRAALDQLETQLNRDGKGQ